MTAPEQPEQLQLDLEYPQPTSPQVQATEEALEQAETAIVPIILGILAAKGTYDLAVASTVPPLPDADLVNTYAAGVIAKGALFDLPMGVGKLAADGMTETVRGLLMMILHPITIRKLHGMDPSGQYPGNLDEVARRASTYAIEQSVESLRTFSQTRQTTSSRDFYRIFDTDKPGTSKAQKQLDGFASKVARWLAREAIFRAEEAIAPSLGYTHKRWITERDERVRAAHRELDGRVRPIGSTFVTQSGTIRYPGDITAPPHLVLNCRCSLEWLTR